MKDSTKNLYSPRELKETIFDYTCSIETLDKYFESGCKKNRERFEWGLQWRLINLDVCLG